MPGEKNSKGFRTWKNKGNGFQVVELHYSADPKKRTAEWKRKAAYGMDARSWATEMELSWETYGGQPVYGKEFSHDLHIFKERVEPDPDYPMLIRGWDFAGNHSVAVLQYVKGQVRVLDEFANLGYNTRRIARDIIDECKLRYGDGFRYTEVIDPSGMWEGKTSTGMACSDIMDELNLTLMPGIQDPSRRIDAVMKYLVTLVDGETALRLNPSCSVLIGGFKGGYAYPEKETQNKKRNRPVKNEYSHIHDALQYAMTRITEVGDTEVDFFSGMDSGGYNFEF